MTNRRRKTLLELAAVVSAAVLLFAAALGAERLFLRKPVATPDVPLSVEASLKSVMLRQIRVEQKIVNAPAVEAAFAAIVARVLTQIGRTPYDVEVLVVDSPVVNAVTLPGGLIVVYSGLARRMASPEQMAAILAHELGHVAHRDSITLLARQLGMAVLLTVLSGGQGETLAQSGLRTLVTVHYSREAEDGADAFAEEVLPRAGIDPSVFGDALDELKKSEGKLPPAVLRYLDPHSAIAERIARARAAPKPAGFAPRRIDVDWAAAVAALPTGLEPEK